MSEPVIKWTPSGESTEITLNFSTGMGGLSELDGFRMPGDVKRIFSKGGVEKTIVNEDPYFAYEAKLPHFNRNTEKSSTFYFTLLSQFKSHADRGGRFLFSMDVNDTLDTTNDVAPAQGDVVVSVNDTTSAAAGDWVLLEDLADPTKWESNKIASVGASSITFEDGIAWSYSVGSVVRHLEHFPTCVLTPKGEVDMKEKKGGEGIAWDVAFKFRTVR